MLSLAVSQLSDTSRRLDLEEIYYSYRQQMMHVANQVLRNFADAEDAVQNAFIRIAQNIHRIDVDDEKRVKAYVLTITRNAAIDLYNQKNKFQEVSLEVVAETQDDTEDLFEKTAAQFQKAALKKALAKIPIEQTEVLLMKYIYGFSYKEIAAALNRKELTVKQQAVRGKEKLLRILKAKEVAK